MKVIDRYVDYIKIKMMQVNTIICGAMPEATKVFPDGYFNCSISSPPYWALRDYSACDCTIDVINPARTSAGPIKCTNSRVPDPNCPKCGGTGKDKEVEKQQLGLESTFEEYIDKLCTIYDEVKRVLRNDGTCWVNLGDTYSQGDNPSNRTGLSTSIIKPKGNVNFNINIKQSIQQKSLCLIPQRFAIEMVNRGWILRNVIIWHKPNPMPSSAKDRFTVDFEYVYFFVKSKKYWFEPQYEPTFTFDDSVRDRDNTKLNNTPGRTRMAGLKLNNYLGRNKRTVWTIPTQPFPEAHFATFPEKLVEPMIKAGCPEFVCTKCGKARFPIFESNQPKRDIDWHPEKYGDKDEAGKRLGRMQPQGSVYNTAVKKGYTDCGCNAEFRPGIVMDIFAGSGTTLQVAARLRRNWIGVELKPEYIAMAEKRATQGETGLSVKEQKQGQQPLFPVENPK